MKKQFDGKVALVTGGGSGIGEATAKLLAWRGAKVVCADLKLEEAERVAQEINDAGGEALAFKLDVTKEEDNQAVVAFALEEFGVLHLAHINAGVTARGDVLSQTVDEWNYNNEVNSKGMFLGVKHVARAMIDAGCGGSIVLTSSLAGLAPGPQTLGYTAAKHGAVGVAKAAAYDLSSYNIRVNAVAPGFIETPGMRASLEGNKPPVKPFSPDHVASAVAFLLSDDAELVTAHVLPLAKGYGTFLPVPTAD